MTLKTHTLRFFIASTLLQKQGVCSILFFLFNFNYCPFLSLFSVLGAQTAKKSKK